MTNQHDQSVDPFSSEGMPTIPLRPMQTSTNINRVYGVAIAVIVLCVAIGAETLTAFVTSLILPQLVFVLGVCLLAFVFAVVRRTYWLLILSLAVAGVGIALPWVSTFGGAIVGVSVGVTFLAIYGVVRIWFDRQETWPFVMSAIATFYALLALGSQYYALPTWVVLPLVLVVVSGLFVAQLRRQSVI
ncbi:MAG: hypothetical protein ACKO83_13445 [Roseiflexaceae bacterium]